MTSYSQLTAGGEKAVFKNAYKKEVWWHGPQGTNRKQMTQGVQGKSDGQPPFTRAWDSRAPTVQTESQPGTVSKEEVPQPGSSMPHRPGPGGGSTG